MRWGKGGPCEVTCSGSHSQWEVRGALPHIPPSPIVIWHSYCFLVPQHIHTNPSWASVSCPSHELSHRAGAALFSYQSFPPKASSERQRGASSSSGSLNCCSVKSVKWVNEGTALNAQAELNVSGHLQVSPLLSYCQMWVLYPVNFYFQVEGTSAL